MNTPKTRQELIRFYNSHVGKIEEDALHNETRSYGGHIRSHKGTLVERMASDIILLAWQGCPTRLSFGDVKTYSVPILPEYVAILPEDVRIYINSRINEYAYPAQVDRHVFVDGKFVMGVECKSYTENAMLKRALIDFRLLKSLHSDLICCLLQLESMLGGDYSQPNAERTYGSSSSHTLMSFFQKLN